MTTAVMLRFSNIENLGLFARQQEDGFLVHITKLTVKGKFQAQVIEHACSNLGAEVIARYDKIEADLEQ